MGYVSFVKICEKIDRFMMAPHCNEFENYTFKITATSPRANEFKDFQQSSWCHRMIQEVYFAFYNMIQHEKS